MQAKLMTAYGVIPLTKFVNIFFFIILLIKNFQFSFMFFFTVEFVALTSADTSAHTLILLTENYQTKKSTLESTDTTTYILTTPAISRQDEAQHIISGQWDPKAHRD